MFQFKPTLPIFSFKLRKVSKKEPSITNIFWFPDRDEPLLQAFYEFFCLALNLMQLLKETVSQSNCSLEVLRFLLRLLWRNKAHHQCWVNCHCIRWWNQITINFRILGSSGLWCKIEFHSVYFGDLNTMGILTQISDRKPDGTSEARSEEQAWVWIFY